MKAMRILAVLLAALLCLGASSPAERGYSMPYYIRVDVTNQIVTVYATQDDSIVRQMLCSTGTKNTTPIGTFIMPNSNTKKDRKEWVLYWDFRRWVQYPSRIRGDILFHSLPYYHKAHEYIEQSAVKALGTPASHGCIRLRWQDAKFICDNCLPGTLVNIYRGETKDAELRELLRQSSFSVDKGIPYDRFLAVPENPDDLGRYSDSAAVTDLQYRLRDLGYFAGKPTGRYMSDTIIAVRQVQAALGLEETGIASKALLEAVYGTDVPAAMNVTLQNGSNGPAVRSIQQNLAVLGLYEGDIDSVYDTDVIDAVSLFQSVYGYTADGVAAPEVQQAVYYEAGRVRALFPDAEARQASLERFNLDFVRVDAPSGLRIRQNPGTDSKALDRLRDGALALCLEPGKEWSKVQSGKCVGYVLTSRLRYTPMALADIVISADGGEQTYVVGRTKEEYLSGAGTCAEAFSAYLAADGSLDNYPDLQLYASVDTEPGVSLNLRAEASTEGEILATAEHGSRWRVRQRTASWTQVEYGDATGYLMNRYLTYQAEPRPADAAPEIEEAPDEEDMRPLQAVVRKSSIYNAPVYDLDSDDAKVIGHLRDGVNVEVLESSEDWSRIRLKGRTGYMRDEDLVIYDDRDAAN